MKFKIAISIYIFLLMLLIVPCTVTPVSPLQFTFGCCKSSDEMETNRSCTFCCFTFAYWRNCLRNCWLLRLRVSFVVQIRNSFAEKGNIDVVWERVAGSQNWHHGKNRWRCLSAEEIQRSYFIKFNITRAWRSVLEPFVEVEFSVKKTWRSHRWTEPTTRRGLLSEEVEVDFNVCWLIHEKKETAVSFRQYRNQQ